MLSLFFAWFLVECPLLQAAFQESSCLLALEDRFRPGLELTGIAINTLDFGVYENDAGVAQG